MPLPVPEAPEVTVTQVAPDSAVHVQSPGVAVTVKVPVPPALGMREDEVGLMARLQCFPVWVIGKEFPSMVTSAFLLEEVLFSVTVTVTFPLFLAKATGERLTQSSPWGRETVGAGQFFSPFPVMLMVTLPAL